MAGRIGHGKRYRGPVIAQRELPKFWKTSPTPPEEQPGSPNPPGVKYKQEPTTFDEGFDPDGKSHDPGWGSNDTTEKIEKNSFKGESPPSFSSQVAGWGGNPTGRSEDESVSKAGSGWSHNSYRPGDPNDIYAA